MSERPVLKRSPFDRSVRRMRYLTYFVLIFSVGCVDTGGVPPTDGGTNANCPMPTAADIQTKVFSVSCGLSDSCHSANGHLADLNLQSANESCASIRQTSCEFPGMPRTTVLPKKLTCSNPGNCSEIGTPSTSCAGAATNARMPFGNTTPLEQCKIDAIKTWIMNGLTGCP